jgi:glycosyltransferase involved in cell wall biosynthesis
LKQTARYRVLHLITGLSVGGAEMMLYRLLSRTNRELFDPAVISLLPDGTLQECIEKLGVPVRSMGMRSGLLAPHAALRLATRRAQADLIQGWMYHGNLAAQSAGVFRKRRTAVIWNIRQSLHSLDAEKRSTVLCIRAGAQLSHLPRRIVYNSHTSAEHHEAIGYSTKGRTVIPNGFDCERLRPDGQARATVRGELGLSGKTPLIGLVARYHPVKDHATFLAAASILARRDPEPHFVMAGRGVNASNGELVSRVAELGLGGRVHLLGERSDTARLNAALDVASLSSLSEAFPNVVGEAMACGVPCVVTDVGDSAQIVGETGIVVPPRDPHALAEGWLRILGMGSQDRRALGAKARRRILDRHSLDRVVGEYEAMYVRILSEMKSHGSEGMHSLRSR